MCENGLPIMTILLFGDITLDTTLNVPVFPEAGKDTIVQHLTSRPGGSIVNTALVLAGLGLSIRLVARAGQDAAGVQALNALQTAGIDLTLVQRDDTAPTGQIFIVVSEDGERTMFSARGANTLITPESLSEETWQDVTRLHLSSYSFLEAPQKTTVQKLIEGAFSREIPISLDIADGHAARLRSDLDSLIGQLDILLLNPTDAAALCSRAPIMNEQELIAALLLLGPQQVALKLGSRGCMVADGKEIYALPPLPAAVIDTTGAGDAFAAGMIYGRHTGLPTLEAAWLASALGALATTVRGAGTALPGRQALTAYLAALPSKVNSGGWRERVVGQLS